VTTRPSSKVEDSGEQDWIKCFGLLRHHLSIRAVGVKWGQGR
jgi:hypothetical protein